MSPNAHRSFVLCLSALVALAAAPLAAAELELTPTVAYRSGDYGCTGTEAMILIEPQIVPLSTCGLVRAKSDDATAFGVILGLGLGADGGLGLELLLNRQETELDLELLPGFETLGQPALFAPLSTPDFTVTHLQAGIVYTWGESRVQPFAGLAAGVSRVEADDPQGNVDFAEDSPSASLGAGLKIRLGGRLGLRLEGRTYWIDLPRDAGGDFTQTEGALGLIIRLG